jgi:hypothetical protein
LKLLEKKMRKVILPKKKIYATEALIELEVSYTTKNGIMKENYVFDNPHDADLFSQEALSLFLKKGAKSLHISLYRKEKYIDTQIDTENVKKRIEGAKTDRKKRIEQESW